ncbi:MAG: hypothetical protein IPM11_03190 [Micropruina sp.]|nr:hypothetical protein [Micropruina sp.]
MTEGLRTARRFSLGAFFAAIVLGAVLLSGCSLWVAAPRSSAPPVEPLGLRLTAALKSKDSAAFLALFDSSTHAQADGTRLFANLSKFASAELAAAVPVKGDGELYSELIKTTWRVTADALGNEWAVKFSITGPEGSAKITSVVVATDTPLWARTDIDVVTEGDVTIVSDHAMASVVPRFTAAGAFALKAVAKQAFGDLSSGWDGRLVLQIPGSSAVWEGVLGAAPGSLAAIGGVTSFAGSDTRSEAQVFINPVVARRAGVDEANALITHEAVHVATGALHSPAPKWMTEGLAESVAAASVTPYTQRNKAVLREWFSTHPLPTDYPSDAEFAADSKSLDAAYSLAQVAIDTSLSKTGKPATYAMIASGEPPAKLLSPYLASVAKLR